MFEDKLEGICKLILDFKFQESVNELLIFLDDVVNIIYVSTVKTRFNEVISYIELAIKNQDFLFLYDLLKYEVKSILNEINYK